MNPDLNGGASSVGLLSSAGPDLQNRILAQASTTVLSLTRAPIDTHCVTPSWAKQLSSPALQPSHLSSTSSSLHFSSSLLSSTLPPLRPSSALPSSAHPSLQVTPSLLSSPLLSTQNRLLQNARLPASLAPPAGLPLPSWAQSCAPVKDVPDGGMDAERESPDSERLPFPMECWSQESELSSRSPSLEETSQIPTPDVFMHEDQDEELEPMPAAEEFGEVAEGSSKQEEDLKNKKYLLLNAVCCSLVNKAINPGQEDWDKEDSLWMRIKGLAQHISQHDPEFLLKVAVYTRQELNIRITANFLLVLAAHLAATKPHVRRYFCAAVQLPSDWLEVTRLYSTCFGSNLPSCLKKALVDKFKDFDEYQLAKYNTRKQRCKHNRLSKKPKAKTPSSEQWNRWANWLGSEPAILQKYLKAQQRSVVDKKASVFSLKKLIQRLHIRHPAEHVMSVLGKRYPRDAQVFSRSGLKGAWQSERAGQRMKLAQADTWERSLSRLGNKASTWEGLIDRKSLPFMAMLRNLRNMISVGISESHHRRILARLTSEESVIKSRQFPFRFLAAYKAILELSKSVKDVPGSKEILRGILQKVPKSNKFKKLDWETAGRKRLRVALGVPFVARIYGRKKALLQKTSPERCTVQVLAEYQRALEKAVQISCRYNVPPLPGRTMLLCDMNIGDNRQWSAKQDFCCRPDPDAPSDGKQGADPLTVTLQEVGVLLSLMIGHCSEQAEMFLVQHWGLQEMDLKFNNLLDNVSHVMKKIKDLQSDSSDLMKDPPNLLTMLVTKKAKVDTIICLLGSYIPSHVQDVIKKYRKDVNPEALVITIFMDDRWRQSEFSEDRNTVTLYGFSEQILRFVAERGSMRLLDHVERIDKLHSIPPPEGAKSQPERDTAVCTLPAIPKQRWQTVRVFVSSTFRDMHSERDVLVRSVFPELRRRAMPYCLRLQEVELRWGITEEEAGRTLELCLSHVCRSQLLLGILGERYGLVPPLPTLPQLPQYQWLSSAPKGLSVTEMEIRQFQALHPDSAQSRMFFYLRTPQMARSVPVAWRADFVAESKEAESKMADLKSRILQSGAKVTEDYPCEWGGVTDGKPYVKGLEEFRKTVLEDLWGALEQLILEDTEVMESRSEVAEQELYQEAQQLQCCGRGKLIGMAKETILEGGARGVLLVEGGAGEGKTVFMAALAKALRSPDWSKKTPCDVISYSTAASHSAQNAEHLLRCFIQWLRKRLGKGEESRLPTSYKNLLAEFKSELKALSDARKGQPLALLIDGAELVQDDGGQLRSDWIPQELPLGMSLVLSVTPNSALRKTLAKMKGSVVFPLGALSMLDKKEIVQKELAMYGKKLSDSAFNNQLQTLLMKKGSASPMYLHLACEELRSYAVFEKMKASLQSLPQLIGPLVQHILLRLQSQHRGLGWALSALTVSKRGLRERELYAILSMCGGLSPERGEVTWQEMMELARKPQERIPLATFSQLFRSLQSLIGQSYTQGPEDCLTVTNPEVRSAFEQLFLSRPGDEARAHRLLAAHLWTLSDPLGKDTFFHCEADAIIHLPAHLMGSGQTAAISFLLSSFHFLYANVRHGLLHHLLEIYSQFESLNSIPSDAAYLEECRGFLKRHAPLLSHWPALFLQQALNEPDGTAPHTWAQGIVGNRGRAGLMWWLNKPKHVLSGDSELVSSYLSKPTCVAVSPGVTMAAVGTENGSLHLILRETGKEVRSLVSCCDGISSCCFLGEGLLASTSFDGQLELWDVDSGCRTLRVDAHTNRITGCDASVDRKHLATVSLDFNLKVWSQKGTLVATVPHPCPLNCVTFDPEGQVLAAGGWDGGVHLWNWLRGEHLGILSGHQQSVRSVSFSPSASLLSSGALSGEVRLWAVPARSCVGCYHAHSGSAEALNFVQKGELLLSAGADGVVQVWSGGLGQETAVLGADQNQEDSRHLAKAGPPALSVAVSGCLAAVGYHGDGVKLYSTESGEKLWNSTNLRQSVRCLLWIQTAAPTGSGEGPGELTEAETGDQMEVEAGSGVLEADSREGPKSKKEMGPAEVLEAESTEGSESKEGAESENEAGSEEMMGAESTEGSDSEGSGSDKEVGSEEEMGAGSPEGSESGEGWETEQEAGSEEEIGAGSPEGSKSGEEWETEQEAGSEEEIGAGSPKASESGEGLESEKEAGPEEDKGAGSPEGSESGEGSESEKEAGPEEKTGVGSAGGSESVEVTQAESTEGSESSEGSQSGDGAESEKDVEGQETEEAEFLVTGSEDSRLRVWRRREEEQMMEMHGCFGVQQGPILALAQSSTLLASASEDGTIVLWSLQELTSDPWCKPSPKWVLREHSGGVTCLSFSPCGKGLISGGKDRVLQLWWLPPPSLSRTLRHCHRDWITGCAWSVDSTAVTCSSDGRVCVWDLRLGFCIKEIPTPLSLTSVCSAGEHVIGTSREGDLLLWELQSGVEVSRIPAHRAPIHHCSILPHKGKENLVVTTASDDGTVKLWRPYNVQHHSTVTGHSGGIRGLAAKQEGVPVFLTVSEDCSLRSCSVSMAMETAQQGATQALVFSPCGSLLVCGFASGRVQVWNHTLVLCTKKVSDSEVTALAWMPDCQLVVGCADCSVSVWKLDWNSPQPTARLHKVSSSTVDTPVRLLHYCSILLGVCEDGNILNAGKKERTYKDSTYHWTNSVRALGLVANDDISTWLLGESDGAVNLGFLFAMGPSTNLSSSFCSAVMGEEEDSELVETKSSEPVISAIAKDGDFVVCGDSKGQIWFNQPPNLCSWSDKKRAHSGRISALRLTESTIISASYDRSVKLWDRNGKRQMGAFVCGGPVLSLAVNPVRPTQLVCGDTLGGVYFLSWRD